MNLVKKINNLRKEKKAVILAHYYQKDEVQKIADFVGDSLALSQQAAKTDAKIIVFAGVHFMAETAKILSPNKKVILPDLEAGCSLADSCPEAEFKKFVNKHPGYKVISYVNTTAAVKAVSDIVCTSSNALKIIESLPKDEKIIFAPDKNLGEYIHSKTGRDMIIWNGSCHVHEQFSLERIMEIKEKYPDAEIISHPECNKPIQIISDFVGSTSALLKYAMKSSKRRFIVVTEPGILYEMKNNCPDKEFIPAPPTDLSCACSECQYMKMIDLEKIYLSLYQEKPEIVLDKKLIRKARKPIERMLKFSKDKGL